MGKRSLEKEIGVSPAIFCLPRPSGAPKKEAAVCYWARWRGREGGGCWEVQLANSLRLMKWIMRGARTDFCANKRRGEKLLLRPDLSGADSLPRGQGPEDSKAGPTPPSQAAFLGSLIIPLLIINIYWGHMGPVLCQTTLMLYLIQCLKQPYEVDLIITHSIDEQTEMQRGEAPFVSHTVSKQWSWVSSVVWHQNLMGAVLVSWRRYVWLHWLSSKEKGHVCLAPAMYEALCYILNQAGYISSILFFNYF